MKCDVTLVLRHFVDGKAYGAAVSLSVENARLSKMDLSDPEMTKAPIAIDQIYLNLEGLGTVVDYNSRATSNVVDVAALDAIRDLARAVGEHIGESRRALADLREAISLPRTGD